MVQGNGGLHGLLGNTEPTRVPRICSGKQGIANQILRIEQPIVSH